MRLRTIVLTLSVVALGACTDDKSSGPDGTTSTSGVALVADFDFEVNMVSSGDFCSPGSMQLTDTSTGGPTEWKWELPSGVTSAEQNPMFENTEDEATLTVTRGSSSDSITKRIDYPVC